MPETVEIRENKSTTAIEALMRRHEEAWNAHDRAAFESLFTEDADFVNVVGQHAIGREAIGSDFEQIHRTFMRNSHVRMLHWSVRYIHAQVAVVRVRWEMTGVDKVPGWNVPDLRRGLLTYVVVEQKGEWKVTAIQNTEEINVAMPK